MPICCDEPPGGIAGAPAVPPGIVAVPVPVDPPATAAGPDRPPAPPPTAPALAPAEGTDRLSPPVAPGAPAACWAAVPLTVVPQPQTAIAISALARSRVSLSFMTPLCEPDRPGLLVELDERLGNDTVGAAEEGQRHLEVERRIAQVPGVEVP